ncbi:penicillin acylase family protein [Phytohabitans houttuyneae]|uniref:Penicillin amidase n=1 Tax=Phytohabitans houttuyneae TaxID=1076126 RepID=A0A6V8KJM5_9ACTN|nr:penicillin acylase family protein [Phytohabitans houttuyneae]GFJ83630.1 penicillin amidase [Phytohabitans houttuyneae]
MRRSAIAFLSAGIVAAGLFTAAPPAPADVRDAGRVAIPGLRAPASVVRDVEGLAHVNARNQHDLFFLQGWIHANDRLFQMDLTRRQAAGTLAELLGKDALAGDVQLRTIGLRRAAERSLPLQSADTRAALSAYADGVNAWLARNRPPRQYADLLVTRVAPWTPVDSLAILKAISFSLSFDMDGVRTTNTARYARAGAANGFDGVAAVDQDLFRFQPFTRASTVPDATGRRAAIQGNPPVTAGRQSQALGELSEEGLRLVDRYRTVAERVPLIAQAMDNEFDFGSNAWAIAGRHTATGRPILANDPHLPLDSPSTLYPITLSGAGFEVTGQGLAGIPYVVVGQNRQLAWGLTTNLLDVTDMYQERIEPDPTSPSGLSTVYQGRKEHVLAIPESYRINTRTPGQSDTIVPVPPGGAVPAATLIVPRRNNGPIVDANVAAGVAVSVQYAGFSGTRELDSFRMVNLARGLDDFKQALSFFDVGSQNFFYADIRGTIAHFTTGEAPLREDLQAGRVDGNPPYLVRDGTGGNEWLPARTKQPGQALPYEVIPFNEMPQVVNPPAGFVINSNNDPAGTTLDNDPLNQTRPGGGIYYLTHTYDNGSRGGRVTDMVRADIRKGRVTAEDTRDRQADVTLLDAQFFTPYITAAFDRARHSATPELNALAGDSRIAEAVQRLSAWDRTTPTGIREGFDASDDNGRLGGPSQKEIDASVAATIFAVWRGQYIDNVIDERLRPLELPLPGGPESVRALKQLLDTFDSRRGVGASGLDFYAVPGVPDAADRRDVLLLRSLADALDRLAGDPFAPAFHRSTDQDTYRWGKLHRIVFDGLPVPAVYSVPTVDGPFAQPLTGLPGLPVDGGFQTVDASAHNPRAASVNDFMFVSGPTNRYVGQATPLGMRGRTSLPGGTSEQIGDKFRLNLLGGWLTNENFPSRLHPTDLIGATDSVTFFTP